MQNVPRRDQNHGRTQITIRELQFLIKTRVLHGRQKEAHGYQITHACVVPSPASIQGAGRGAREGNQD